MNPFEPPSPITIDPDDDESVVPLVDPTPSATRRSYVIWAMMFGINLIVPIMFSSLVVQESGAVGMIVGIVVLLSTGWWINYRSARLGRVLTIGGFFVAVSQLVPIAHVFAGMIGLTITTELGAASQPGDDDPVGMIDSLWGGFICTIITGTILALLALIIGWIVTAIGRAMTNRGKSEANPSSIEPTE